MKRILTKILVITFLTSCAITSVVAQTITVHDMNPGPYAPGSTVAVPVHIDYTGNCIPAANTFKLYFSNNLGVYPSTPVATATGFYISFINFTVPATAIPGIGYKVKITSSANPGATIVESAPFTVIAGTGVTAGITGPSLNGNANAFGNCSGTGQFPFNYQDKSSTGSSAVTFYNEKSQSIQATKPAAASGSFTADQTNYTVIATAISNGITGTFAYPLINNPVNNGLTVTFAGPVCLIGGLARESFTIPYLNNGTSIKDNFPGDTYVVDWGDGTPKSVYTLCDIIANSGNIEHDYTRTSCGQPNNVFKVTCQPSSTYCGGLIGTQVSSSAAVVNIPTNKFTPPATGCTNVPITIDNGSDPGSDPSKPGCQNVSALYTWTITGNGLNDVKQNLPLSQALTYTFTSPGTYNITLTLQNGSTACPADPVSHTICIQDRPKPAFNLTSNEICMTSQPVIPVNTSVVPAATCSIDVYQWVVSPASGVSFVDGTTAASQTPHFNFSNVGVYKISLNITDGCGNIEQTVIQNLTVNAPPTATLAPDFNICGSTNLTFNFEPTAINTKTTIGGTADNSATYVWTVTPSAGVAAATFADGTTAASEYPHIHFPDYGSYAVSVKVTNGCSSTTSNVQNISFITAPTVTIQPVQPICAGDPVTVTGTVTGTYTSISWASTTGTGTFVTDPNNPTTTTYTPSADEVAAGKATLELVAYTASAQCGSTTKKIDVVIKRINTISSSATASACSGNPVNYQIKDLNNSNTFSWKVDAANTTATGASAGTGSKINDVLSNTSDQDEKATYIISPVGGSCNTDFVLTVTVRPATLKPSFTITTGATYCGANTINFINTSTPQNSQFLWDFGDGTTFSGVTPPAHSFTVPTDGKDKTYTVKLSIIGDCSSPPPATQDIKISPATPVATINPSPLSGCGVTTFTVLNMSPGDNVSYTFHVKDMNGNDVAPPQTKTDKSAATFVVGSSVQTNYFFSITATNQCGISATSVPIAVPMSPQDIAAIISSTDSKTDCFPFTTILSNSSGGTSYYYKITNPDGTVTQMPAVSGTQQYTFPNPGTYSIQLFASDACSLNVPSNLLTYIIYPQPAPDFTSSIDCTNTATFTNITGNTNNAIAYEWDFGDGSAKTNEPSPQHAYVYDAQHPKYTVTLTATNSSTQCSNIITHDIEVSPLLTAQFDVTPFTTINIPDYHFNFIDKSIGAPTSWLWDFGDGQTSTLQNPGHTYAYGSVGDHKVTLTVTKQLCGISTTTQTVTITGVPGQLYLPNAFIPTSNTEILRTFMAKGAGIKTLLLQIFNNYGQLVWQTTKLDSNGSPVEGWDGTFKGAPAPQGAYTWQASATFINGSEWKGMTYSNSLPKRTGTVNLIR